MNVEMTGMLMFTLWCEGCLMQTHRVGERRSVLQDDTSVTEAIGSENSRHLLEEVIVTSQNLFQNSGESSRFLFSESGQVGDMPLVR